VEFQMNIADAVTAGRVHHQWLPNVLTIEKGSLSDTTRKQLIERGHVLSTAPVIGQAMGIAIEPGTGIRLGGADPRSADSKAVGY
jgi:gamma-glutamyltranspeptidase/glutathione hydrolase